MTCKFWTWCFFIFCGTQTIAQQPPEATQQFLPKLLPKSPEAASLAKYGTYEVSMYSGVPNISIPLYEIQVGELRVPISLSYHASGVKVSDMASWVGLGWSVSAGGTISRKVMGRPDELQGGYLSGQYPVRLASSIDQLNSTDLNYLKNIVQGYYDVEPDIYSYSMPGKGGKFLYNHASLTTPIILPYDPVEITRTQPTATTQLFKVVDESGIQFRFDTYEWTTTSANSIVNNDAISSWMLSHMISANKQDTIYFNYNPRTGTGTTDVSYNETFVISDNVGNMVNPPKYVGDLGSPPSSGITYSTTTWQVQKEIIFRNGKIVFEQGTDSRLDATGSKDAPKRLNAIKVYSFNSALNGYKLIKTIKFYQSYFTSSIDQSKRLRLDSIGIFDPSEAIGLKTRFEYNTTVSLPDYNSKSKDYWGYYNGKNNTTLIPGMTIPYENAGTTSNLNIGGTVDGRDPAPAFMQAYMLNKIIHPTGGNTQFEFETNQYQENGGAVKFSGGLRVKKIKSYDGVSLTPVLKTYKYGVGESGYGRANFTLSNYFFQSQQTSRYWELIEGGVGQFIAATKRVRSFFSAPTNDLEPYDGVPVGYATVTEYIGDESTNMGKTVFQFNDQADVLDPVTAYGRPVVNSYHFNRGQLIQKDVFRKNSSSYTKIASTLNQYEFYSQQWLSNIGLVVFKQFINQDESFSNNFCPPESENNIGCFDTYSYLLGNYSVRAGDNKLTKTTEILYDEDDVTRSQTVVTDYAYDNFNHQQITRIERKNSRGELLKTTRKYPHEFQVSPYTEMVANHIYNKTVEDIQENVTLGVPLSKTVNSYNDWTNGNYLIGSIKFQNGSNPLETRAEFLQYDNFGNIQEMKKTSDISHSYLWDYKQTMVVAEVKNAAQTRIAYTSFESDGKGNWQYSGIPFWDGSAPTGKKVYALSSGSITRAGVNPSGIYIVSYWSKSGIQTVSNTLSTVTGRSLNGWTQYEHKINYPGSVNILISGSGTIDELRLYPEQAQMVTRTYEPLVGITSEIDQANHITYYEYDDLKRLMLVRDQDQKIVKKFCYNYSGEPENCNIFYNISKQNTFTRSCPVNNTGSAVTYIVPANIYSAYSQPAADAMAQTDVNTNGQAYANATGTCTPVPQTIQGYNAKSFNYRLRLTNVETAQVYNFTLTANNFAFQNLGSVPSGIYNIQFQPLSTPVTATFKFNAFTYFGTGGASFSNVSVNALSQGYMY